MVASGAMAVIRRGVAPAHGPPHWAMPDAGQDEFDPQAPPAPDCEFD
jgi:hypothetical protein